MGYPSGGPEPCLEGEGDEVLWTGHIDSVSAFYEFGLPTSLREYFGLPETRAGVLGMDATLSAVVVVVLVLVWVNLLFLYQIGC